jgi:hypothetical protein
MEPIATNIRPTIAMYWEADRSAVKARYDALFPSLAAEESPTASESETPQSVEESQPVTPAPNSKWTADWDTQFRELLVRTGFSEPIAKVFLEGGEREDDAYRPILLHHLLAAVNGNGAWPIFLKV